MKKVLIFCLMLFLAGGVFAFDPHLNEVTITPSQAYLGKQVSFQVTLTPSDTNGNVRFYDDSTLVEQRPYVPTTPFVTFTKTYNTVGTKNVKFVIADFNETDSDISNNEVLKSFYVKKGLDLSISSLTINPANLVAGGLTTINFTVTNLGDENFWGNIPVEIRVDSNVACNTAVSGIDVTTTGSCEWLVPKDYTETYQMTATVNKIGDVNELTLTNNSLSITISGTGKPNLVVNSVVVPDQMRRGFFENIAVSVKNLGGSSSSSTQLVVSLQPEGKLAEVIYSGTIPALASMGSEAANFVYFFSAIGNYTILANIDTNNSVVESNEGDNNFGLTVHIYDFNINTIAEENEKLAEKVAIQNGQIQACEVEKKGFMNSLANCDVEKGACATNLAVCNQNNSTKIANWVKDMDANRAALDSLYQAENIRITGECNTKISVLSNERDQWSAIVLLSMAAVIGYVIFTKYWKPKNRSGVGFT